jgi:F0F1-type ATP synthase delta subunit
MNRESEAFLRKLLSFLPSTDEEYRKSIEYNGEILETVIIEDIFMPEIIKLLKENKDVKLLEIIFDYFEEVSNCRYKHLINIFSITVLEILGNDKVILEVAKKYMGSKTIQLQIEADRSLGRS